MRTSPGGYYSAYQCGGPSQIQGPPPLAWEIDEPEKGRRLMTGFAYKVHYLNLVPLSSQIKPGCYYQGKGWRDGFGLAANCLPQQGAADLADFPGHVPRLHFVMRWDVSVSRLCPNPTHSSGLKLCQNFIPSPPSAPSPPKRESVQTKWFSRVLWAKRGELQR